MRKRSEYERGRNKIEKKKERKRESKKESRQESARKSGKEDENVEKGESERAGGREREI